MERIIEFLILLTTNYGVFALIGVLLTISIPLLLVGLSVLYFSNVGKSLDKKIAENEKEIADLKRFKCVNLTCNNRKQ